ncbi:elongation factor 2-like [Aristolochia californica]|uniref:elongation factor 2-like n=1 Tax=Aristolochia californica TaxID=171875 RepID=UPI0035DB6D8A
MIDEVEPSLGKAKGTEIQWFPRKSFPGKVCTGMKVSNVGRTYALGPQDDLYIHNVQRTVIWMGTAVESAKVVPCGQTESLVGWDQFIPATRTEGGVNIVAGAEELHLEICLKNLQDYFMGGAEIIVSPPVVSFGETVIRKSPSTHHRLML